MPRPAALALKGENDDKNSEMFGTASGVAATDFVRWRKQLIGADTATCATPGAIIKANADSAGIQLLRKQNEGNGGHRATANASRANW
jgi:hypothetical protein